MRFGSKLRQISILIGALLCFLTQACYAESTSILFVFFDAGETLALRPVTDRLSVDGVAFKILALGTSRKLITGANVVDINKNCGIHAVVDETWPRTKELEQGDLDLIKKCVDAPVVVTGIVSRAQLQISKTAKIRIAFDDNLTTLKMDDLPKSFMASASDFWVASQDIATSAHILNPKTRINVVGQPTVEEWSETPAVAHKNKTILYAGGYGATYESAFQIFVRATKGLKEILFQVALHPKSDGKLEKRIIDENHAAIIVLDKSIPTRVAAAKADLVVTQHSSVGVQAAFTGKPVIYLDIPGSEFSNVAIAKGWSPLITDESLFTVQAKKMLGSPSRAPADLFSVAGIPRHSVSKMTRILETLVESNGPTVR